MIVEVGFDVFKEFSPSIDWIVETSALKHFPLKGAYKGFRPSVVVGISTRGHALAHARGFEEGPEGFAAVLTPPVAVKDRLREFGTRLYGLLERRDDQLRAQIIPETPPNDTPGAEIDHHGQVKP